jgi:Essential protein Yae1, N terminal
MDEDIFDSLFHLEDGYYNDGYRLGVEDGSRAGRIEGRVFGLEQGFEKFLEMGQLNGRACVWAARMPQKATTTEKRSLESESRLEHISQSEGQETPSAEEGLRVTSFPPNSRLEKHISTLYALSEAESLSIENTEDTVSDFDDRFKRAQSKAKVIENIIKEREVDLDDGFVDTKKQTIGSKNEGIQITKAAAAEKNMEDFGLKRAL